MIEKLGDMVSELAAAVTGLSHDLEIIISLASVFVLGWGLGKRSPMPIVVGAVGTIRAIAVLGVI